MAMIVQHFRSLLSNLSPYNKVEYGIFILFSIGFAIDIWHGGLYAMNLLAVWGIIKLLWSKQVGNPALNKWGKIVMISMLLYYGYCLLSFLWTENFFYAKINLSYRRSFLILPLYFLLCDTSYLKEIHIKTILYTFSIAFCIRFYLLLLKAIFSIFFLHESIACLFGASFDTQHHTFLALFTAFGFTFLVTELFSNSKFLSKKTILFLAISLECYTFLIQSRIGIICIILCLILPGLYQIIKKGWHLSTLKSLLILLLVLGTLKFSFKDIPQANRLGDSLQQIENSDYSDVRFYLWDCGITTIKQNLPWGCGIGDIGDVFNHNWTHHPKYAQYSQSFGQPHNQILFTLSTYGIPGIILLGFIFCAPVFQLTGKKINSLSTQYLLYLIIIYSAIGLVDALFNWTIGCVLFCFFYCIFWSSSNDLSFNLAKRK